MNIMNQMKHGSGLWLFLKNIFVFMPCWGCFYVHFCSYSSFILIHEAFLALLSGATAYFMNYMKNYEEGKLKGFFGIALLRYGYFMNLKNRVASYKFINWRVYG